MINSELGHVKTLEEFNSEIRRQQEEAHGKGYCDIHDAIKQHKDNDADLTVITSIQNHQVPYGVIHYEDEGRITKVDEKPQLSFPMNTGVYIANSRILKYIDSSQLFHMTHLIDELIANNKKVSCYFISEKEFVDFGQWNEYKKSAALIS